MANYKTRGESTPEDRAACRVIHEKFSRERPSLKDLVSSGDVDPDSITTQGDYAAFRRLVLRLRQERERQGLSLKAVAERMGPTADAPALSRLERGENDNPTINTIARYAAALGKRIVWGFEDASLDPNSR
jgi:hypothetical protein